jgi:hypothetical protein
MEDVADDFSSDFAPVGFSQSSTSVSFSLDGEESGIGVLVYTSQSKLNVSYELIDSSVLNPSPTLSAQASAGPARRAKDLLFNLVLLLASVVS